MKSNTDPAFVGLEKLIAKQRCQLDDFERWAVRNEWLEFHRNHYDWWMFPYNKPSRLGQAYTVYEHEVNELKKNPYFIRHYLRGVELLLLSWGWDLYRCRQIDNPAPYQEWADWPIRLYKCAASLLLFGFTKEFDSVRRYATLLIRQGKNFWYDGKDYSELFRLKLLYIHGLSSSGSSRTAKTLRNLLPETVVYSPDLPVNPAEALSLLQHIITEKRIDVIIGTSMGGMFAQKLRGKCKILVNPSFHVSASMRKKIGINPFFSERENEETEYEITEELCNEYEQIEKEQFEHLTVEEISQTIGLFGTNDDTVNCMEEYKLYYRYCFTFPGSHRLSEENIRVNLLPLIKKLAPDYLLEIEDYSR